MVNETIIEKAALAMVNLNRSRGGLEPITSLTHVYSGATVELIKADVRAALEAVASDIRNASLEEAKTVAMAHNITVEGSSLYVEDAIQALKTKVTP